MDRGAVAVSRRIVSWERGSVQYRLVLADDRGRALLVAGSLGTEVRVSREKLEPLVVGFWLRLDDRERTREAEALLMDGTIAVTPPLRGMTSTA